MMDSYNLTHVILPRLSRYDCSLVVFILIYIFAHMVFKYCQCSVKVMSSFYNVYQPNKGILEAFFKINSQW